MIYEIINKGKGLIASLIPENLLKIKSEDVVLKTNLSEFVNDAGFITLAEIPAETLQNIQNVLDTGTSAIYNGGDDYLDLMSDFDGKKYIDAVFSNSSLYPNHALNSRYSELYIDKDKFFVFNSTDERTSTVDVRNGRFRFSDAVQNNVNNTSAQSSVSFTPPLVNTNIYFPAKTAAGNYTLATLEDMQATTLQAMVEAGGIAGAAVDLDASSAYGNFFGGTANNRNVDWYLYDTVGNKGTAFMTYTDFVEMNNYLGTTSGSVSVTNGLTQLTQQVVDFNQKTSVKFASPTVITNLLFPAKAIAGDYTLATQEEIPFELVDEGNGVGIRKRGVNPAKYGNIGLDAFDLSYSSGISSTRGATGTSSTAFGEDIISSGYGANSFGYAVNNSSIYSMSAGANIQTGGYMTNVFGVGHQVTGLATFIVGQAAEIINDNLLDWNAFPQKIVFAVGNGTIQNNDQEYTVLTRSNALQVRMNGLVEAPTATIAEIDADATGKALTTKEYVAQKNLNEAGQVRINYTGLGLVGFVADVAQAFNINAATPTVAASPTTTYPTSTPNSYAGVFDATRGTTPTGRLIENPILGQTHTWRFQVEYAGKVAGNNGALDIILTNPVSGFQYTMSFTLPSGRTSGILNDIAITIADNASISSPNGYILQTKTSFTDATLEVNVTNITRVSHSIKL